MSGIDRRCIVQGLLASGLVLPMRLSAQERTAIEDGARKEGKVALATSVSASGFPKFLQAFSAKYPFLEATSGLYSAPTGRVLARVDAEMQARKLSFDLLHVASSRGLPRDVAQRPVARLPLARARSLSAGRARR